MLGKVVFNGSVVPFDSLRNIGLNHADGYSRPDKAGVQNVNTGVSETGHKNRKSNQEAGGNRAAVF